MTGPISSLWQLLEPNFHRSPSHDPIPTYLFSCPFLISRFIILNYIHTFVQHPIVARHHIGSLLRTRTLKSLLFCEVQDFGMKVTINHWRGACYWKWKIQDQDMCGICRNSFEQVCANCKYPGDGCPLIWGECSHVFHLHCLLKWLESGDGKKEECPMDRQPWKTKT